MLAGNVMLFVAPGTERVVLARLRAHVRPDGIVVAAFATDRDYPLSHFDSDTERAGLVLEQRFATWDLRPWKNLSPFAVSILRCPSDGGN